MHNARRKTLKGYGAIGTTAVVSFSARKRLRYSNFTADNGLDSGERT